MRTKPLSIILALTALAVCTTAAEARQRKPVRAPLGGGFLDLGEQARLAGPRDGLTQSILLYRPIYSSFRPDSYGSDVLPGRFGGIGR